MAEKGWIKIYRQLRDCWVWKSKPFSKGQAWIDLLLKANHKDTKILFNGNLTTIKKGQILTSIRKLVDEWGWSKNTVTKFLNLLEEDGMLTRESDNHRTLITIENYSVFQDNKDTESPQVEPQPSPHPNPQGSHTLTTYNNDKNYKNDKNNNIKGFVKPTIKEVEEYCNQRNKGVDAETFYDFYESKGWMVGKNKMKDWKAAVRTWERSRNNNCNYTYKPQQTSTDLDPQIQAQLRALEEQQLASMPDVANMSDEDIDRLIRGKL